MSPSIVVPYRRLMDLKARPPSPRSRRALWAVGLVALGLTLSACTTQARGHEWRPSSTTAVPSVVFVATATRAEPAVRLPRSEQDALLRMALHSQRVDGAPVAVVVQGRPTQRYDLTPMRGAKVEHNSALRTRKAESIVEELAREIAASAATGRGLDLLGTMDRAGRESPQARIVVLSSGVSTVAPLDLRQLGWPDAGRAVADALRSQHALPQYVGGHHVTFYYLADASGTQPTLPVPLREGLIQGYLGVCRTAAAHCTARSDPPSGLPARATASVPVVRLPAVRRVPTTSRCRGLVRIPSVLLFAPDSSVLGPGADTSLRVVATTVLNNGGHTVITRISGHTADVDAGDGASLSERRARAVAKRLRRLGVPAARIRDVVGLGETQPVAPDRNEDGSVSPSSALNRRVDIRLRDISCSHSQREVS